MKQIKIFAIGLILLAMASLIGCDILGDTPAPTHFILPATYISDNNMPPTRLPVSEGKTVKFYGISEDAYSQMETGGTFTADFYFTGTTGSGGSNLSYQITEDFNGRQRYLFAIISLDSSDPAYGDYDLQGKTLAQIMAIPSGKLIFGMVTDAEDNPQKITLAKSGGNIEFTLQDIYLIANSSNNDNNGVVSNFLLPGTYYNESMNESPIPTGKTVKFYGVAQASYDAFISGGIFSADFYFTGTTQSYGSSNIPYQITDAFDGQDRYLFALIILNSSDPVYGNYDLRGKTYQEILDFPDGGKSVFGLIPGPPNELSSPLSSPQISTLFKSGGMFPFCLYDLKLYGDL